MKIYLDVCAIQRPLDTPNQVRIVLEAEAVLGILSFSDTGLVDLVSSEALIYEIEQNPLPVRKEHAIRVLAKARSFANVTEEVKARSKQLLGSGIKPLDALHLALAEASNVDFYCTCDDRLLRHAKQVSNLQVRVISPIDLVQEIEK